jgi:hypothetical protein
MNRMALAFISGSLVPAIAIFCLGGDSRACLVAGALAVLVPALLFARKVGGWLYWVADAVDAVRGVSVSRKAAKKTARPKKPSWLLDYSQDAISAANKPAPAAPSLSADEIVAGSSYGRFA